MTFINDFLSLIYPRYCEACNGWLYRHETFLCNHCLLGLPKTDSHLKAGTELEQVFSGRVPAHKLFSYYMYQKCGRVQRLLHALKYQGQKELGAFVGGLYATELGARKALEGIDLVIPVPLHEKKLRSRGYNQSEWFAKGLCDAASLRLETGVLKRRTETSTQTKKRKYERWENVEGIFELINSEMIADKHILLVDDVITTGATIEAAWQALKEVPGIRLSVASIAFAGQSA